VVCGIRLVEVVPSQESFFAFSIGRKGVAPFGALAEAVTLIGGGKFFESGGVSKK